MRFDLRDMRLFLTVVECGSLTKGAAALHLALASVSERIASMEAALGATLLERNSRGVRPTAAGEALMHHARAILSQVESMHGDLRNYATGLKGRIRLLSNSAAMAAFLPLQLCDFLRVHRDLSIDLIELTSADIVQSLVDRRADLGIVADIADFSTLETHPIAHDRLVAIVPRSHRFASLAGVRFTDVVDEPVVGVADAALQTHLSERAARLGRRFDYRIQLRNIEHVAQYVEAGVGISILSDGQAKALRHDIAIVPLAESWARRRLYLCAARFSMLTPQASLLAQQLRAIADEQATQP